MSEEQNRQVVQNLFEAFGRGDIPALLGTLSADVDWQIFGPDSVPYFGPHRGHDGVTDFFVKVGSNVEFEFLVPREFIAQGDKVVVLGDERGRVKSTRREFENQWAMVFTLKEGKITRFRSYEDTSAVAGAFDPPEG